MKTIPGPWETTCVCVTESCYCDLPITVQDRRFEGGVEETKGEQPDRLQESKGDDTVGQEFGVELTLLPANRPAHPLARVMARRDSC